MKKLYFNQEIVTCKTISFNFIFAPIYAQTKIQFELLFLLLLDMLAFRYMYLYFEQDAYRYKFDLIGLPLERSERCGFRAGFPKTHIKNRLYRRIISRNFISAI